MRFAQSKEKNNQVTKLVGEALANVFQSGRPTLGVGTRLVTFD